MPNELKFDHFSATPCCLLGPQPFLRLNRKSMATSRLRKQKTPQPKDRDEIDCEHDAPQADICSQNLHATVQYAPNYKYPRQPYRSSMRPGRFQHKQKRCGVEKNRPFKLISKICTDPWLIDAPRVATVFAATDAPCRRGPDNGESDIQDCDPSDMGKHGKY